MPEIHQDFALSLSNWRPLLLRSVFWKPFLSTVFCHIYIFTQPFSSTYFNWALSIWSDSLAVQIPAQRPVFRIPAGKWHLGHTFKRALYYPPKLLFWTGSQIDPGFLGRKTVELFYLQLNSRKWGFFFPMYILTILTTYCQEKVFNALMKANCPRPK